jgi:hypothetical protein
MVFILPSILLVSSCVSFHEIFFGLGLPNHEIFYPPTLLSVDRQLLIVTKVFLCIACLGLISKVKLHAFSVWNTGKWTASRG